MEKKRFRSCGKLSTDVTEKMILLYKEGNNYREISKILNINYGTVSAYFNRKGYISHPPKRKYSLNEYYFQSIDSIDKAYFLGFLYADGNVSKTKDGYRVKMGLQERDSYILEKFARYCNYDGPILFRKQKTVNHQHQKLIQIYSKIFYENACKHGLHDNKTFTLKFPTLDKKYYSHFLRGYLDGDGSVFMKQYKDHMATTIHFLGTYDVCNGIKKLLKEELNLRSDTKIVKKKLIFKYTITDRQDLLKVFDYLYSNMNDCYLSRKFEKFQEIKNYIEKYYEKFPGRY